MPPEAAAHIAAERIEVVHIAGERTAAAVEVAEAVIDRSAEAEAVAATPGVVAGARIAGARIAAARVVATGRDMSPAHLPERVAPLPPPMPLPSLARHSADNLFAKAAHPVRIGGISS